MAIYLDDEPFHFVGGNLGAVLDAANKRVQKEGRVIVEVHVGERALVGEALRAARDESFHQHEVKLISADPSELALSTLRQVRDLLTEAHEGFGAAAEAFQTDDGATGMSRLGKAMDIWHQLPTAILHSASLLNINLDQMPDELSLNDASNALADQLRQLREHVQNNDTVALADSLAYEWPKTAERWDRILVALINRIELRS